MKLQIWMVSLNGPDVGIVVRAFLEEADARSYVQNYVHAQWNEGYMGDAEFPDDLNEAVQQYFETNEDEERYCIRSQVLNVPGVAVPQLPAQQAEEDDVVDLDEEELKIVAASLNHISPMSLANILGINGNALSRLWDRVPSLRMKLQ